MKSHNMYMCIPDLQGKAMMRQSPTDSVPGIAKAQHVDVRQFSHLEVGLNIYLKFQKQIPQS